MIAEGVVFKPFYKFCSKLACDLTATATTAKLVQADMDALCAGLGNQHHTYLVIAQGARHEVVKATCADGKLLLERGRDNTTAQVWNNCAVVSFDWSPSAMTEAAQQVQDAMKAGDPDFKSFICEVVSDTLTVTNANDDGCDCHETCGVRIEAPKCQGFDPVQVGNVVIRQEENGCLATTPAPAGSFPQDGVYENATVVIKDGKIIDVKQGTNIIKSTCGSCCGD
jgi:hypothetical protein